MAGLMVQIAPQDELLRLTGSTGNPLSNLSATFTGNGVRYGANRAFIVRPIVAGAVTGAGATMAPKLQYSPDGATGWTDGLVMANVTASNNQGVTNPVGGTGALPPTVPPAYTYTLPAGNPWVRAVLTLTGTSPVFNNAGLLIEPAIGF